MSIEGTIGVGKSALATEVAHRLAERQSAKRRGRAFTALVWFDAHNSMLSLVDLARTLALATGDLALSMASAEHKAEALRAHLVDIDGEQISVHFLNEIQQIQDVSAPLRGLTVPALFIHGEVDQEVPFSQSSRAVDLVAGERLLIPVPGGDHCLERPQEREIVYRETVTWLRDHL